MSLLEQIRAAAARHVDVEVTGGVIVRVRSITHGEFEDIFENAKTGPAASARLILIACSDPASGDPAFASLDEVAQLPLHVAEKLNEEAQKLTDMSAEAVDAAGKDSSATPGSSSPSPSPSDSE